jgi:hypothetical protein
VEHPVHDGACNRVALRYDIAIAVIGDQDFVPVLQHVRRLGKRVAIASIKAVDEKGHSPCYRGYDDRANANRVKDFDIIWLDEPSSIIRQIFLGRLLDSVVSQRQSFLENTDADESLNRGLAELSERVEKAIEAEGKSQIAEQEKKLRDYQGWALSQIQKFNDEMNAAEGFRVPFGLVHDGNDYAGIKHAITNYLLPVSVGLLDPAVSRLFNEAFERGWKKLENKKDLQTEVAKQEAVVQKRKP